MLTLQRTSARDVLTVESVLNGVLRTRLTVSGAVWRLEIVNASDVSEESKSIRRTTLLNLSRAWSGVLTKATPLPDVWNGLAVEGIKFRRGQVCMVAAAKVPTLFFSADTDTTTVMMRSVSHLSGHSQVTVEANLSNDSKYYNAHLDKLSHIKWVFDSSPNIDDLELEIRAYVELYGHPPELIVIDNLMNITAETDNEWAGLRAIMMELHDMARKTEACVMVLHHVSEQSEYGSPSNPPHRRAIHGKVSQLPALILTLGYYQISTETILR